MIAEGAPPSARKSSDGDVGRLVGEVITVVLATGSGFPEIELVAESLGTSVRTLQRRLNAKGVTFTKITQQACRVVAQQMLKEQQTRIGDIARALGYSHPAHFTRAFQRWTGFTPRAFRGRSGVIGRRGQRGHR